METPDKCTSKEKEFGDFEESNRLRSPIKSVWSVLVFVLLACQAVPTFTRLFIKRYCLFLPHYKNNFGLS